MDVVRLTRSEIVEIVKKRRPAYTIHFPHWEDRLLTRLSLGEMDRRDVIEKVDTYTGQFPIEPRSTKHLNEVEEIILRHLEKRGYVVNGKIRYYFKLSNFQLENLFDLAGEVDGDFFISVPVENKRKIKLFSWLK
ncbi:hypothetical protein IAQ67_28800 (plasmid) [Paenibacillus peoriae]|uniref:Uncharacterized protein n=1 Tax=Paenibacillus peoriae TaxID=59893 RepID=A0A7H0YGZ9_9BACL|nr:hypothetical protein [Paenibacillus peoriae]QNR70357.1 hypothetical protein IAQ67_28800 [Paenibacillus peoriae]